MPIVRIQDISAHEGQEVTLEGWIYAKTGKGRLQFLQVRDGTGIIQCVAFKKEIDEESFAAAKSLTQESAVRVTGTVRADDRAPGTPGGFEVGLSNVEVVHISSEYPITPKDHGVEFLSDNRHLWLRSQRQWAIMRIRSTIMRAMREWLDTNGFMEVTTPIITPSAAEGTSTLFGIDYFGEQSYLAQTGQLYNEANMAAFGKVYCFGPTFRAEKSKTRRHLTEFWMIEPEIAFCKLDQLLEIEEQFTEHVVQTVLSKHKAELEILERDTSALEKVTAPFPRITYDEALEMLADLREKETDPELKEQLKIEWGDDFGSPHETVLTQQFEKPVFVTGYPTQVKAFYMTPHEDRPEVCYSADLLAPEGYGEIIGGSQRISDHDQLLAAIEAHDLPVENYDWYLDLRKYGSQPHSGFGMGLERTIAWICGLGHIREASPYPRMLQRNKP